MRLLILIDKNLTDKSGIESALNQLKGDYAIATPFEWTYETRDFDNLTWVEYQPNALGIAWNKVYSDLKEIKARDGEKYDNILYMIADENWKARAFGGWSLGNPISGFTVQLIRNYTSVRALYMTFAMEIAHSWNDMCLQEIGDNLLSTFGVRDFDNQVIHGCDPRYGFNVPPNPPLDRYYTDYNYKPMIVIAKDKLKMCYEKRLQRFLNPTAFIFTRDLSLGSVGEDVRQLQIFLNNHGFVLADTGVGSKGQETTYFGRVTQNALIRYQKANGISPAIGYFGPKTRASLNSSGVSPDAMPFFDELVNN